VYLFYRGFGILRRKRLIQNTPTSKIRSAAMGLVEVNGLAVGPYVMNAPITGLPCYYHRSMVWQWKQSGKNKSWQKVADECRHLPFYLDDNTGRLLINPQGAEMDIHRDFHEEYRTSLFSNSVDMPGNVSTFLSRHGISTDKKIKVEEYCIKPKNFLFVLGTLSQNPGLDATVAPAWAERADRKRNGGSNLINKVEADDLPLAHVVRLSNSEMTVPASAMTQQQKIAAALSRAGMSTPAVWSAAGTGVKTARSELMVSGAPAVAIETAVVTEQSEDSDLEGFDLHPPVVLMKGSHQPAFFISWRSQRDVVKSLGWKSDLMIWGGPALTLTCIYFLLAHFDWL